MVVKRHTRRAFSSPNLKIPKSPYPYYLKTYLILTTKQPGQLFLDYRIANKP